MPSTLGFIGSYMYLKAMAIERCITVITNRTWQEVVLDIRPFNTRPSADKAAGFEMIARAEARFREDPLHANLELAPWVQMSINGDGLGAPVLKINLEVISQVFTDTR